MDISSTSSETLVVDANIAVWAVLPMVAEIPTLDRLEQWHHRQRRILAPSLWIAEAVSVLRLFVYKKLLAPAEGEQAIDDLFALGIETLPLTQPLCQLAFAWASKLQQARAYDSMYLALAEQENAWLWTADKRLVNGARQRGFLQISWIGSDEIVDQEI